jgi:small subunit ribosomal protein S4
MKIGPKYKIAKRLGAGVFDKTQTQKFELSKARSEKSRKGRFSSRSEYAKQLLEKQKVRVTYYVTERQFKNYVTSAAEVGGSNPSETLYVSLETRLDNILYRLGLAPTRQAARQMVTHGHIVVNGNRVDVPSYHMRVGDSFKVREGSRGKTIFTVLAEKLKNWKTPSWLSFDVQKMEGKVVSAPKYERAEHHFDLAPVMEFYSR